MLDLIRRLVWFAVVATAACFAIFFVLGNFFVASAQDEGPVPVRDVITSGTHRLSGILVLPLSCEELSVQPRQVSASEYALVFTTWQDPSIACPQTPTPRQFNAVVFAPSDGISFIATLDGKNIPIIVLPDTATSTAS